MCFLSCSNVIAKFTCEKSFINGIFAKFVESCEICSLIHQKLHKSNIKNDH